MLLTCKKIDGDKHDKSGCMFYQCFKGNWACLLHLKESDCKLFVNYIAEKIIKNAIRNVFRINDDEQAKGVKK